MINISQHRQHTLHQEKVGMEFPTAQNNAGVPDNFNRRRGILRSKALIEDRHDCFPRCQVRDSGHRQHMFSLERCHGSNGFRAVNSIRDDCNLTRIVLCEYLKHRLQTSDCLSDKGFRWSHLGASCLTGSCCPELWFPPGNWDMVLVAE